MRRVIVMSCCLVGGMLLGSAAVASPGLDLQIDRQMLRVAPSVADRSAPTQAGLMRRWIAVGKCVVGRDRMTSIAFVRAAVGSDDASEAARRLDPIFASCLAGSGAPGPASVVLRRTAVANALGIALPRA